MIQQYKSLTFGNGAKNSTLVRSDSGTVEIRKNLNATKGGEGNSFSQTTNGATIYNYATLKEYFS